MMARERADALIVLPSPMLFSERRQIVDLAVHPVSNIAYVAVRKSADKKSLILTVDGSGKIGEFALENVKHAVIKLPADKAPLTSVTDVAWAGDRLLVAVADPGGDPHQAAPLDRLDGDPVLELLQELVDAGGARLRLGAQAGNDPAHPAQ